MVPLLLCGVAVTYPATVHAQGRFDQEFRADVQARNDSTHAAARFGQSLGFYNIFFELLSSDDGGGLAAGGGVGPFARSMSMAGGLPSFVRSSGARGLVWRSATGSGDVNSAPDAVAPHWSRADGPGGYGWTAGTPLPWGSGGAGAAHGSASSWNAPGGAGSAGGASEAQLGNGPGVNPVHIVASDPPGVVPEPATIFLLGTGLFLLGFITYRRRRSAMERV